MIIPDIHIWQSFLQGDKASFKQLMELHYKPLYHYAARFTPDTELVKDCIQELFIGLWDRRLHLSTQVNPRAYLIASLRRGLHRKMQSEKKYNQYRQSETDSVFFDFEISIEEKIIAHEKVNGLAKQLAVLVDTLPKRQKEVIYLKFFQDMSRDEIAAIMGNTPQTVSNLLQLALKRLRVDVNGIPINLVSYLILSLFLF